MSDDDGVVIPLRPQLSDDEITGLLEFRMLDSLKKVDEVLEDLKETIKEAESREPHEPIFAYGSLVQYLKTLSQPELEHLLAGALWKMV